jgi:XTP/dITP diphosphohydrolase
LPGWTIRLLDADDFPPETGATYLQNALAKARYGREVGPPGDWMLGEDSGIEVAALGGRPGIRSARWAADPIAELLRALAGTEDRRARYVCALVAIAPDGRELHGTGVLAGRVASEPRGSQGFGYDPIFVPDGHERTVAELGDAWKWRHSHRARAAARVRELALRSVPVDLGAEDDHVRHHVEPD